MKKLINQSLFPFLVVSRNLRFGDFRRGDSCFTVPTLSSDSTIFVVSSIGLHFQRIHYLYPAPRGSPNTSLILWPAADCPRGSVPAFTSAVYDHRQIATSFVIFSIITTSPRTLQEADRSRLTSWTLLCGFLASSATKAGSATATTIETMSATTIALENAINCPAYRLVSKALDALSTLNMTVGWLNFASSHWLIHAMVPWRPSSHAYYMGK